MIDKNRINPFLQHADDFKYCQQVIQDHSSSFYHAFSQLPQEDAWSVYAIYAYCRLADDLVDEAGDLQALTSLRQQLEDFEAGMTLNHPIWRALRVVFDSYPMNIQPFYHMLEGQLRDLNFQQPQDQEDLLDYCYYVAGTVGLMLLPIIAKDPQEIESQGIALGQAMQITNILRDIGEDLDNGRIYIPKEVMEQFDYAIEELENKVINDSFIAMWEYEAKHAEDLYQSSLSMLPHLKEEARLPVLSSLNIYCEILDQVRGNDYDSLRQRAYVSQMRKFELVARSVSFLERKEREDQ